MRPIDEKLIRLRKLLRRLDRHLEKRGITRPKSQTLHQFARRLCDRAELEVDAEPLSEWYRRYAGLRYGQPITPKAVDDLEKKMPAL
jgi:protoheme ferro-lyase